jgi:hypothetical protein
MGMYTEIKGEEVKFSGRLAEAAFHVGVKISGGVVTMTHGEVCRVVRAMVDMFEKGVSLVMVYDITKLESDARKLRLLAEWTHENYELDTITFA